MLPVTPEWKEEIVNALGSCDALRLPARLSKAPITAMDRQKYLEALLSHDPGVFLERHGKLLSKGQRMAFEPLRRDSYEVDFYLKLLEDEEEASQNNRQAGQLTSTTKNRRLAKMTRLAREGYFDEDAARRRAPLLHHQYIGQYQSSTDAMPRANTLHDQIIQQHEEQQLRATMAAQQREEELVGEAFNATLSESESESGSQEDSESGLRMEHTGHYQSKDGKMTPEVSEQELQQNKEDFRALMEGRFLSGEDGGKDADGDASLDDDWARERQQDIMDKYFET